MGSEFGEALQAAQITNEQEGDIAPRTEEELVYVANRYEKIKAALVELEERKPEDGLGASGKDQKQLDAVLDSVQTNPIEP